MVANSQAERPERRQAFLNKCASRMTALLLEESPEDRSQVMDWAEKKMWEYGLLNFDPKRTTPWHWSEQAIADNPHLFDAIHWAMENRLNPMDCESAEQLMNRLIPGEIDL